LGRPAEHQRETPCGIERVHGTERRELFRDDAGAGQPEQAPGFGRREGDASLGIQEQTRDGAAETFDERFDLALATHRQDSFAAGQQQALAATDDASVG
jgi:hypothetical protein